MPASASARTCARRIPASSGSGPAAREQPLGRAVPLLRRHLHHRQRRARGATSGVATPARADDDRRQVRHARVVRALEALEVERERPIERRAAQEERRRRPELAQDRQRDRRVAREVVVERDRDGKPLAAPPRSHRVEQPIGRDDVVVPDDVPNLRARRAPASCGGTSSRAGSPARRSTLWYMSATPALRLVSRSTSMNAERRRACRRAAPTVASTRFASDWMSTARRT